MPKQKGILLMVRWSIVIYGFTVAFEWLYSYSVKKAGKNDEILYMQAFVLLSEKIRKGKEWELGYVASNFNSSGWASCPSHSGHNANISTLPPSILIQPQFLTLRLRTSPAYRDQLENPALVSGAQGLVWCCHLRPNRAPNFGQEPLQGQGNFLYAIIL